MLYELHVGTFTAEGTFEAAIPHLRGLRELGVTAIELMPVGESVIACITRVPARNLHREMAGTVMSGACPVKRR